MVWALDLDDFNNMCGDGTWPLLTAVRNALGELTLSVHLLHLQ